MWSPRRAPLSEINVTPFVDVMLVLLVIFMVAAPMLQEGISVALPSAATGTPVPNSGIAITLTKEHTIYVDGAVKTMKELREYLHGVDRRAAVLIRADRSAYVSRLVDLWDLCRDSGFKEIRIATMTE